MSALQECKGWELLASGRFAHTKTYLEQLAERYEMKLLLPSEIPELELRSQGSLALLSSESKTHLLCFFRVLKPFAACNRPPIYLQHPLPSFNSFISCVAVQVHCTPDSQPTQGM